ncbi:hypothetical protein A9Q86_02190 [Flavobacteriales bacterium 33_180_T64]|nr:hypothetical protein A9Q86_02190 [Flavobacteriales bacterium 33_180_T64]
MELIYINFHNHFKTVVGDYDDRLKETTFRIKEKGFVVSLLNDGRKVVSTVLSTLEQYFCTTDAIRPDMIKEHDFGHAGRVIVIADEGFVNPVCCDTPCSCNENACVLGTSFLAAEELNDACATFAQLTLTYTFEMFHSGSGQYPVVGDLVTDNQCNPIELDVLSARFISTGIAIVTDADGIVQAFVCK